MRTSLHINKHRRRIPGSKYDTTDAFGMYGMFSIPISAEGCIVAECLVSAGDTPEALAMGADWEHVSVKIVDVVNGLRKIRIPTWDEMCKVKELFWNEEETVIQIHPAKSEYVNTHACVLHLWRPRDGKLRLPPKICV